MQHGTSSTIAASSEERLIPLIRARLARKLADQNFQVKEIAQALKVTQPAVTQYISGKRGVTLKEIPNIDSLVDPLAEKLAKRIRSGLGIETAEILETARQIVVMNSGKAFGSRTATEPRRNRLLELLRSRLRLELGAAEKYLELANGTSDDYTKLLLRMIASDSIRHGDVVSQLMSWLESGGKPGGSLPDELLLKSMLSIEDSASETKLTTGVSVDHPVARLLLQWIDIDEGKHEKVIHGLIALSHSRKSQFWARDQRAVSVQRSHY